MLRYTGEKHSLAESGLHEPLSDHRKPTLYLCHVRIISLFLTRLQGTDDRLDAFTPTHRPLSHNGLRICF